MGDPEESVEETWGASSSSGEGCLRPGPYVFISSKYVAGTVCVNCQK